MAGTDPLTGSGHVDIHRPSLEAARRRLGLPEPTSTLCGAPSVELVVDADGTLRFCDQGACGVTLAATDSLATAWGGASANALRAGLAEGHLPLPHCGRCAVWLAQDLYEQAPPLRDYGHATPRPDAGQPRQLVLYLPAAASSWSEPLLAQVLALVPTMERVVLTGCAPLRHAFTPRILAALDGATPRPQVAFRLAECGELQGVTAATLGPVADLEVTVRSHREDMAAAKAMAAATGAKLRLRFVLTPEHWFEFEDVAHAAAALSLPVDLRLLDRGAPVPLAAVSIEDLRFVKEVVLSAWTRFSSNRPTWLVEGAIDSLCTELRTLLRHEAKGALRSPIVGRTPTPLQLPSEDHPWCTDTARRTWWLQNLFGHAHLPVVLAWLLALVRRDVDAALVRRTPWLRALCHRLAWDRRVPELLELLRTVYAEPKTRGKLTAEDAAFANEVDLKHFGGPCCEGLGLLQDRARKRPFALGKPRAMKATTTPDLTVVIPSYQHGQYIEETIRSVLAQRYTNFVVLVVDDCSPDDTVARARSIQDPRLSVRVNETNLGLGNSVLQALATIETPFIALLNSDDLFHPDRLTRCRDVLKERPTVQLVTTGLTLVDHAGGELTPTNASLVLDGKQVFDWVHWYAQATPPADLPNGQLFGALLERNFLATSSNLVCRTEWLRAQADSLRSLKYCLDWQLFLQAALGDELHHVQEPLVAYRLHATNTVWFREGRRWSYYLEVNRVAAAALRRFAQRGAERDEAEVVRVLDAIAGHLTANRETDGYALFLNTTFDALQVDRLAATSPRVQELLQQLNATAESVRRARDAAESSAPHADDGRGALRLLLGDLAAEQALAERDSRRWLEGYVQTLEGRLRESYDARGELETDKRKLQRQAAELQEQLDSLQSAKAATDQRAQQQQRDLDTLRGDISQLRGALAAVQDLRQLIAGDLTTVRGELTTVRGERDTARGERDRLRGEVSSLRVLEQELLQRRQELAEASAREQQAAAQTSSLAQELAAVHTHADDLQRAKTALTADLATEQAERATVRGARDQLQATVAEQQEALQRLRTARDDLQRRQQELDAALVREKTQVDSLGKAKQQLEKQREGLVHEVAKLRAEMDRLARSREFRSGNFLWNKMPLGYLSRRGKKWYRRFVDAKDRALMTFKRRRKAEGTAVVAACWHWPIYSHTFVYQEMIGLTHMGLAVKMFHWELGDTGQLHKAFGYLADHRTQLQPIRENHVRDKAHFEKTKPGRLRAFLELVGKRTGRKVEELEQESIVLQACTFARMAELAGAKYLHSYFFYDQSFMTMLAAWLLELPRGVSCYADHMLDDYAFKLVPLHVELASVVVATSARIKKELSAMTGGKFDDKILVKPNGVDGARFPPVVRNDRKAGDPFEVISISRIEPKKGLTHLVEAIAELKKRGHKVKAHVVGSKDQHSKGSLEYAADFERRIAELGLQEEVILHGMKMQEDLPPILQRCRAFVAPYVEMGSGDKDGIPTAMLEGLASGLPVITTNSGSILEVVDHQVEGLVVPQRDSMAFANALELLIKDPAVERRMAKAARARFDRDFDIRVTEKRLHERVATFVNAQRKP